jgi:hypothetical protein
MGVAFPRVNGKFCDFTDINIFIAGKPFVGIKDINYKHTREPGKVRGTAPKLLGRTRGEYDAEGGFTMYQEDAIAFRQALGPGYMERDFDIVVIYRPKGGKLTTDRLIGCCITEEDSSHSQGTEPLVEKFSLHILDLQRDGLPGMLP